MTFLHQAILLNHVNLVKLLVGNSANVNFPHIFMKDEKLEIEEEIKSLKKKLALKQKNKNANSE